jgi:hypothetical protein
LDKRKLKANPSIDLLDESRHFFANTLSLLFLLQSE